MVLKQRFHLRACERWWENLLTPMPLQLHGGMAWILSLIVRGN
jgi:hypothetical protein